MLNNIIVTFHTIAFLAQAQPKMLSAKQVESIFQFKPAVRLAMSTDLPGSLKGRPEVKWVATYENRELSAYSVSIGMFVKGKFRMVPDLSKLKLPDEQAVKPQAGGLPERNFTFKTVDGRKGTNVQLGGLGGLTEITTIPHKDGKHELVVVIDWNKPDIHQDSPKELIERWEKAPKPMKKGRDVVEAIEELLASNRSKRLD